MSDLTVTTQTKPRTAWISYVVGFVLSVALTIEAYLLVTHPILHGQYLLYAILALAGVQLAVQLVFFLHIGQEVRPRWNFIFLLSTAGIIATVIVGSIWIMNHLNYRMMPSEMNQYLLQEEGIYK